MFLKDLFNAVSVNFTSGNLENELFKPLIVQRKIGTIQLKKRFSRHCGNALITI